MSVLSSELKLYGSAVMPEDNTTSPIGGAIDLTTQVTFAEVSGLVQVVSSDAADSSQNVTVHYQDTVGDAQSEVEPLTGLTPAALGATMLRILKAVKSATTAGDVAVEHQTATHTGTAQAGSTTEYIVLDTGASAVDGTYVGQVLRLDGGTGASQIRRIIRYEGANRRAWVSGVWSVTPDATTTFRIAPGMVFEKVPSEVLTVRRPFYLAAADTPGGSARNFHEKVFRKNTNATLSMFGAQVTESSDPSGLFTFALAIDKDDTGNNGSTRLGAPSTGVGTFDSAAKAVPLGTLAADEAIGIWLRLTVTAGHAATQTVVGTGIAGATV